MNISKEARETFDLIRQQENYIPNTELCCEYIQLAINSALAEKDKRIEELEARNSWLEARYRGTEKTTFQFHDKTSIEVDCFWENGEQIFTAYALCQIEEHKLKQKYSTLLSDSRKLVEILQEVAQLPIARSYPDGPCLEKSLHNDIKTTLSTFLAKYPQQEGEKKV